MSDHEDTFPKTWKQKLYRELTVFWLIFAYLAFFFGTFTWYRRLILSEYQISYLHYGAAIVEALVLAKVILLGDALRLGRHVENEPLIYTIFSKAVIFTLWVALFKLLEHELIGLFHNGLKGGLPPLQSKALNASLAECLVSFCAFVPFFAFRELSQTLGEGEMAALLLRKKSPGSA